MSHDLPRVTHILAAVGLGPDLSGIPPAVLEIAAARGTAVHTAIEALAYGYFDAESVDLAIVPYLDAYHRFVKESGHEPIASEVQVVHRAWGYRGHIDRVGWLAKHRAILDWKAVATVDERASALQLAGYRAAWNASHPTEPVDLTGVVQLRGDGTYRFYDINAADHEQTFLAAVMVYLAQQRRAA